MEAGACSNGKERTPVGNSLNECPVRQGKDKRERETRASRDLGRLLHYYIWGLSHFQYGLGLHKSISATQVYVSQPER